ncbi:hypothetical protein [Microbulbifer sp. 2205BS26-8]|uniref:hypothetical protein n=1 Tax=Microbulbifer sp. 2205BS26-8 TaxID=3064386 RepID=UPI00273ED2C5|nr:hypothetical protein [Microbulbifer sp. 2205BS26-8]MDP5211193.1 hypothetical protein [Microbulbifer sp. 2205BS26-8]
MNNNVKLLDHALVDLGQSEVEESPLFQVDTEFLGDDFTRVHSVSNTSIPLTIDFLNDGIEVHLGGASEVFSWGRDYLEKRSDEVLKILTLLLVSNIQVVSHGDSYKKFVFKEASTNKVLKEVKVFDGFLVNPFKKCEQLFPAIIRSPESARSDGRM